jgi:hypothetical protein
VVVVGSRGRLVSDRPFVPGWDPSDVVVESASGRVVHTTCGANHFLHLVEHFAALVRQRRIEADDLFPAEDGVGNVATCVAIERACRIRTPVEVARV